MSSFFILFSDIPCGTKFLQELIFQIFAVFQKSTEKFLQKKSPQIFSHEFTPLAKLYIQT